MGEGSPGHLSQILVWVMELKTLIAEVAGCHPMKHLCWERTKGVSCSILWCWGKEGGGKRRDEEEMCPTAIESFLH